MPNPLSSFLGLNASEMSGAQDTLRKTRLQAARNLELDRRFPGSGGVGVTGADIADMDDSIAFLEAQDIPGQMRGEETMSALNTASTFNRPEVRAMRDEEQGNALSKLLLPVQAKAQVDAVNRNAEFAQQLMRDRLNNEAIAERQQNTQGMIADRGAATRSAQSERQMMADRLMRARKLEESGRKTQGIGFMDWMTGRPEKELAEAESLRQGSGVAPGSVEEVAYQILSEYPGQSIDQLISAGVLQFDSPAELAQLEAVMAQLQGQE